MSTFKELQQRMANAKFKATVYQHLIDHLETEFRPVAGKDATKVILTDEKIRVPDETFDQVVSEIATGLKNVNDEMELIGAMPMQAIQSPATPTTPVAVASVPVQPPAERGKKSKSTNQGESQP
jgi:hypothetical protein